MNTLAMVDVSLLGQQLVNGLFFGGQMALMAVGLTLVWGVARVLNFAHGAMFMVGGYAGYYTVSATGSLVLAVLAAVVVVFLLGVVTEVAFIEHIREREESEIAAIILTLGVATMLENGMRVLVGSERLAMPTFASGVWVLGSVVISHQRFLIFAVSIVAIAALFVVVKYTKLGLGIRAVSQDKDAALLMGIRPRRIYATTFGMSAALAGLAGVLLAPIFAIYPTVGQRPFLLAFIVVIVGGLGSVRGTLVAALFLAIVRSLSFIWLPSEAAQALLFVIMIVVLFVSPEGIGGWLEA